MNKLRKNPNMKNGFVGLVTLFFVVAIGGYIATNSYYKWINSEKYANITGMTENIVSIVSVAIQDSTTGYMNSSGGDCSSSYSVTDISAIRVRKCAELNETIFKVTSGGDETNGDDSYFRYLETYGSGCKVKFDDIDSDEYYLMLDCDMDDTKLNFLAEDTMILKLEKFLATSIVTFENEALDLITATGGTDTDGKIRIRLRK